MPKRNSALRQLQPGTLVLGTVHRVEARFAHVLLDGVKGVAPAVLPVGNFSCRFTRDLQVRAIQ